MDAVYEAFNPYYAKHCADLTVPYDGILPLLQKLQAQGVVCALVSNKPDYAVQTLAAQYFPGLLAASAGAKDGVRKKPAPDSVFAVIHQLGAEGLRAVYIGDSEVDLQTAQNALFVAESPLVIGRALDAGCAPVSFLMETKHVTGKGVALLARCPGVPVYAAEEDVLTNLTGFHLTRGMLCAMRRPPLADPAAVLRGATRVAVLENVMNPTNLGAIFRSAAALGMDAVLLTSAGSDPLYRRAIRVSMGTVFQVPWAYVPEDWPALLRAQGFRMAAMALRDDSVRLDDPRLTQAEKLAVVMGTEGDGLADATIAACDFTVRIPMHHGVDSLNVAAASAVAFYQLGRRA